MIVYIFPPIVIRVKKLPMRARGLCALSFIFLKHNESESTLRHELQHWYQQRKYTPIGVSIFLGYYYFKSIIIQRKSFWNAWRNNPLEKKALAVMYSTKPLPKIWYLNKQ